MVTDPSTASVGSADLLVAGENRFMPLVRPVLVTGTMASILVPAQISEGVEVGVEARVLTHDGEPVEARELQWHRPLQAELNGARWIPGTLSTAGLVAGDYRLEVTASWGATSTSQTRSTDFTVDD